MKRNYFIRRRRNRLLEIETLLMSIGASMGLKLFFHFHWSLLLVSASFFLFISYKAFLKLRWFRYLFSILFSLMWAFLTASWGAKIDREGNLTAWVFGLLTFLVSLYLHKNQFDFLQSADEISYDKR